MNCHEEPNEEERLFFRDFLLHSEKILTDRTNFFLVAESMFITAYAADHRHSLPFIIFGFLLSIVWLFLQDKIYEKLGEVQDEVKSWSPQYERMMRRSNTIPSNKIIAYVIPILFMFFWGFLLATNISR